MKCLSVLMVVVVLMCGCATVETINADRPTVCVGQNSLIYDTFGAVKISPKTAAGFFSMALYAALEARLIYPEEAKAGLATIEALLTQSLVSYYTAFTAVADLFGPLNTGKVAGYIAFAVPLFAQMQVKIPISDCDRYLLVQFCAEQRTMIAKYFGD